MGEHRLQRAAKYPFQKLVTGTCGFDDVESALVRRQNFEGLKIMFVPRPHS